MPAMAAGAQAPLWPLAQAPRRWTSGGRFGASRSSGARKHAGIDLGAPAGTPVLATEPGEIVRVWKGWAGGDTARVVERTDSGLTLVYAAISKNGIAVSKGDRVDAGQLLGVVGTYPGGSQMLHFETYAFGNDNRRWATADGPPDGLLNPTDYLERAMLNPGEPPDQPPPPPPPGTPGVASQATAKVMGWALAGAIAAGFALFFVAGDGRLA